MQRRDGYSGQTPPEAEEWRGLFTVCHMGVSLSHRREGREQGQGCGPAVRFVWEDGGILS